MEDTTTPPLLAAPLKPSAVLLVITTLVVVLNVLLEFAKEMTQSHNPAMAVGSAMSGIIFPVIIAVLFSISKGFRNPRSRTKVVLWTSVVMILSTFAMVEKALTQRH